MKSVARCVFLLGQAVVLVACSSFTHEYIDGGSVAQVGGRTYSGVDQSVFTKIDASKLASAGVIGSTNEPTLASTVLALPGIAPERAFVAKRSDGTIIVFVLSTAIANGRLVGQGVPELCPLIQHPSPGECP